MLVDGNRYDKNDLLKALIQFKADHKETLPTKKDWKSGEMNPSLRTFQRRFKNIEEALEKADKYNSVGEFEIKLAEDEQRRELNEYKRKYKKKGKKTEIEEQSQGEGESIPRPRSRKSTATQHYGFQCPFCGNWTTNPNKYYSSLTIILSIRFIKLLNSSNGNAEGYFEGVLDSIYKVFGPWNPVITRELEKAGFHEAFDKRFGINKKEFIINDKGGN